MAASGKLKGKEYSLDEHLIDMISLFIIKQNIDCKIQSLLETTKRTSYC